MTEFTNEQRNIISAFLAQVRDRAAITRDEWLEAYQSWARGDWVWSCEYGFGGTDINTSLWWYQYRYKPGSKEWRPRIIIRALLVASERDYVEPERLPVDEHALRSTQAERKRTRKAFIKKHGVAAFYQKVKPILAARRHGGVKALFTAPASAETREYVAILSAMAGGQRPNDGGNYDSKTAN